MRRGETRREERLGETRGVRERNGGLDEVYDAFMVVLEAVLVLWRLYFYKGKLGGVLLEFCG